MVVLWYTNCIITSIDWGAVHLFQHQKKGSQILIRNSCKSILWQPKIAILASREWRILIVMIRWFLGCSWRMVLLFKKMGGTCIASVFCGLDSCTLRHLWQLHLCTLWHNTPLLHTLVLAFFSKVLQRDIWKKHPPRVREVSKNMPQSLKTPFVPVLSFEGGGRCRVFWRVLLYFLT